MRCAEQVGYVRKGVQEHQRRPIAWRQIGGEIERRSVILVDDGLGTGLVQLAAITALRRLHTARCVVASPLATPAAIQRVARRADQVFVLRSGAEAHVDSCGHWRQSLDDEIAAGLVAAYRQHGGDTG